MYEEETDLNLLHILSANDGAHDALLCLLDENAKSANKPKLDINHKSGPGNDCWTATHLACCYGNLSILEILLDNGADPEILDKNELDAFDIATAFDQFRCLDLMRRKMKSKGFSKTDLNKSCDTVFYSFRSGFKDSCWNSSEESHLDPIKISPFNETVSRVDARLQTSGQFNQTVGGNQSNSHSNGHSSAESPVNNHTSRTALPNIIDRSKTERKANRPTDKSTDVEKPPSSASKVLDRHRQEYEQTRKANSTFIKEYEQNPLRKTAVLNELKKDLISKSVGCKAVERSHGRTTNKTSTLERSTSGKNVIRDLRKSFRSCTNETEADSDDSISPFNSISTITLGQNKELYVDSEFDITFVQETTAGLGGRTPEERSETSAGSSADSTLKEDKARLEIEINVQINRSIHERLSDFSDHPIDVQISLQPGNRRSSANGQANDYESLDDDQLFDELVEAGLRPGPVNANTRSVYIKRLRELKASANNTSANNTTSNNATNRSVELSNEISSLNSSIGERLTISDSLPMFSRPLREMMTGKFDFRLARQIESEFIQNFDSQPSSRKQFFNYLLLDPRITQDLVKRSLEENPQLISQLNSPQKVGNPSTGSEATGQFNHFNLALFKLFVLSIFYIGKGQGNRPYSHLYDAAKLSRLRSGKTSNIKKLNKIQEIWAADKGVISLHAFHNVSSVEALTRECFMIDAIGIKLLTNIQIGQNRIKNLRWTQYKKDVMGAYLLYKAYNLLLVNGERQIKRADIAS